MKQLIQFIFPTVKAICAVVGFILGLGWGAYALVETVARAEADTVRKEIREIRGIDIQHLDKRFDRIEALIKDNK
jgi:hypothetical protein